MMQVWGKVTKFGAKIINPDSASPYCRFYLYTPYRLKSTSLISVNWWHWDWEPMPGDFIKATGFFEVVVSGGKTFTNLYIYGNIPEPSPGAVVPGVKAERSPNWSEYPHYSGKKKITSPPLTDSGVE